MSSYASYSAASTSTAARATLRVRRPHAADAAAAPPAIVKGMLARAWDRRADDIDDQANCMVRTVRNTLKSASLLAHRYQRPFP
eukprot:6209080-Pleurochrysis_carterae.AAC.3